MSSECKLCKREGEIRESHLIPAFVGKWMKNTSPTGYLRQVIEPNLRRQDLFKQKLLCPNCEELFSKYESKFAESVFYEYVNNELDDWGIAQGKIKTIEYSEWLLQFVVSLQWRALITFDHSEIYLNNTNKKKFQKSVVSVLAEWEDYLLGLKANSGNSRHYVMFVQNLAAGRGSLPDDVHPRVNTFLLRAVDSTLAYSEQSLFLYTKLGPIVILSGVKPRTLKNMNDCLVRKNGSIKTAQHLANSIINQFIFVDRPREAMNLYSVSKNQQGIIDKAVKEGAVKGKGVKSVLAGYSDTMMRKGKRIL